MFEGDEVDYYDSLKYCLNLIRQDYGDDEQKAKSWILNLLKYDLKIVNTLHNTLALPITINPNLALVMVTFNLLGFVKNPIPYVSFDLTHDIIMKSFSLP